MKWPGLDNTSNGPIETVQELFASEKIDLNFLEAMEEISEYWQTCVNFVTEVWQRDVGDLTEKQDVWVRKILEDCVEKRISSRRYVRA